MNDNTEEQLHRIVLQTVEELEADNFDAYEWLNETLGIESFTVSISGDVLGAEIAICVGGPGVWVDTKNDVVEGRWGGDKRTMSFRTNDALDDLIQEHYQIMKGN